MEEGEEREERGREGEDMELEKKTEKGMKMKAKKEGRKPKRFFGKWTLKESVIAAVLSLRY